MKYGLSERSYRELMDILSSSPEIEKAVLYGSRARGDNGPGSDIDLSLHGAQLTRRVLSRLSDRFYYSHIPYFIDMHVYSDIRNPLFKENVDRDGITIYVRE